MSLGDRLHVIAVGGGLAAFLLLATGALAQQTEGSSESTTQTQQSDADNAAAEFHPTIGHDEAQAAIDAEARERAEQAAHDDLLAQQSMAGSTEDLVDLTGIQIGFGFVETVLLIATTVFTAIAARAAAKAAKSATAAVNVAELARIDADRHARQQLRAYIGIQSLAFELVNAEKVMAEIRVVNCGQTPAKKVEIGVRATVQDAKDYAANWKSFGFSDNDERGLFIFPQVPWSIFQQVALKEGDLAQIRTGAKTVFVYGVIRYVDIFDKPRYLHFSGINADPTKGARWNALRSKYPDEGD